MTLALIVWLVMTAVPGIKILAFIGMAISIIFWAILGINYDCVNGEYNTQAKAEAKDMWVRSAKNFRWAVPLMVVAFMLPNKETSWYMVGAYAAETAVTSEVAGELGSAAKDMMLQLMQRAKEEVGQIDAEQVKDVAKAAVQEATK
jgi:O-antigen/teichoic acid export membrane protein